MPVVRQAVAAGELPLEHAAIIAKVAANGTPTQRQAATSPTGQETLLKLATGQDAATFALTTDRWAADIDPDGLERDHQAHYRATQPTNYEPRPPHHPHRHHRPRLVPIHRPRRTTTPKISNRGQSTERTTRARATSQVAELPTAEPAAARAQLQDERDLTAATSWT